MLYFDTSFLAPLFLEEPTSIEVERFMTGLPAGELAISHSTRVEFSSLLAGEVRMGGLDGQAASDADAQFETVMTESFAIWLPNADDFTLAKEYLGIHETGLGAGDALNLAIARNHGAKTFYSLEESLLNAGKLLGVPVSVGIRIVG
jgi:predicted nucleic acid-binding protein